MNTPRIGDTVHYAAREPVECHPAKVTNATSTELTLQVPNQDTPGHFTTACPPDPGHGSEDFTPGTWHHTH